ncbi:Hypothetical protein GbCGDNIH4_1216 [Granulibacter bethesdensis CGDNIH4]|nr:Hypothetical protein GbCGDNIH4_1216 [Granulibacter bethesdensis CGDNIH4]
MSRSYSVMAGGHRSLATDLALIVRLEASTGEDRVTIGRLQLLRLLALAGLDRTEAFSALTSARTRTVHISKERLHPVLLMARRRIETCQNEQASTDQTE